MTDSLAMLNGVGQEAQDSTKLDPELACHKTELGTRS